MLQTWTSAQVRAAEEPLLAAGAPLMERAAFALQVRVASVLRERRGAVAGARVVVLVGPGNNGGDALHAGALLARRGVEVHAVVAGSRVHEGGLSRCCVPAVVRRGSTRRPVDDAAALAAGADLVLDGLLGIGSDGSGLRGVAGSLVEALLDLGRPYVVAVDLPSGLGVDDGRRDGIVLDADLTVTFGCLKPGLLLPPGTRAAGRVEVVDLGLDLSGAPGVVRLEPGDVADLWPVPSPDAHKYTRGVVGVVAGSRAYQGAAVLATSAAVRAGVGMVRYLGDVGDVVVAAHPEVVVGHGRVQAWVFGPGVSPDDAGLRRRVGTRFEHVLERARRRWSTRAHSSCCRTTSDRTRC